MSRCQKPMHAALIRVLALLSVCILSACAITALADALEAQGPQLWSVAYATALLQRDYAKVWDLIPADLRVRTFPEKTKDQFLSNIHQRKTGPRRFSDIWVGQVYIPVGESLASSPSGAVCLLFQYEISDREPEIWRAAGMNTMRWLLFERRGSRWVLTDNVTRSDGEALVEKFQLTDTPVLHLTLTDQGVIAAKAASMPKVEFMDAVAKRYRSQMDKTGQSERGERGSRIGQLVLALAAALVVAGVLLFIVGRRRAARTSPA